MPNNPPHFPIKHLPKDFPIDKLTLLKRSKFDFDPSEPQLLSIFCFHYKVSLSHALDHWCFCKIDDCPYHC